MKPRPLSQTLLDVLAMDAARVLSRHGTHDPDWKEWVALRNSLLKVQPSLGPEAARTVGLACSAFGEAGKGQT